MSLFSRKNRMPPQADSGRTPTVATKPETPRREDVISGRESVDERVDCPPSTTPQMPVSASVSAPAPVAPVYESPDDVFRREFRTWLSDVDTHRSPESDVLTDELLARVGPVPQVDLSLLAVLPGADPSYTRMRRDLAVGTARKYAVLMVGDRVSRTAITSERGFWSGVLDYINNVLP